MYRYSDGYAPNPIQPFEQHFTYNFLLVYCGFHLTHTPFFIKATLSELNISYVLLISLPELLYVLSFPINSFIFTSIIHVIAT